MVLQFPEAGLKFIGLLPKRIYS